MRKGVRVALACVAALAAPAADAGECAVNGSPVSLQSLTDALEQGPTASLPGQLAGVPFSVVRYQSVSVYWVGCAGDCLFNENFGESECGNLVESPIDSFAEAEVFGVPHPPAFSQVLARQSPNGKWDVAAQGFVSPNWDEQGGHAAYNFRLGTREVIDVTSGSAAEMLPLEVHFRAIGHLGIQICQGNDIFYWIPLHTARLRVIEDTSSGLRTLVNEAYNQFFQRDEVFPVEVRPNSILTVDVYFQANANAGGALDASGFCVGGAAPLDFMAPPSWDGIQVAFAADPALTLTPRSGFVYEPLPEPESAAGIALLTLAVLGARRARARAKPSPRAALSRALVLSSALALALAGGAAQAQPLANGDFDDDVVPWVDPFPNDSTVVSWSPIDAEEPSDSGSLQVESNVSNAAADGPWSECLPAAPGLYTLTGRVFVVSGAGEAPLGFLGFEFYDNASCLGEQLDPLNPNRTASVAVQDVWIAVLVETAAPAGTAGLRVRATVGGTTDTVPDVARFDRIQLVPEPGDGAVAALAGLLALAGVRGARGRAPGRPAPQ